MVDLHPDISINTLCFAPDRLDRLIEQVARIGARGISPDLEQVLACGAAPAARSLRDSGLAVATLTHRSFGFASSELARSARERLDRTIDIATQIGAGSIIMTTGGLGMLGWNEAVERFAEAVAPCAAKARAAGIRLGIEPTSHLYADVSIAHRLSDTCAIAAKAGLDVMIDLFACWFDSDIDCALTEAAPRTALVQVSDYVLGDRALPCRAVPGDGDLPLEQLIGAILGAGYRGWFDLEIIGPRLLAEGTATGLIRAAQVVGRLLDSTVARPTTGA